MLLKSEMQIIPLLTAMKPEDAWFLGFMVVCEEHGNKVCVCMWAQRWHQAAFWVTTLLADTAIQSKFKLI